VTGRDKKGDGERFADLVNEVVPLHDRDRSYVPETRMPEAADRERGASHAGQQRFVRDTGAGSGRAADAARRLVSELHRGDYPPDREIDLHGLRRDSAKRALLEGLGAALASRERCVLVIHGLGKRSPDGPVLKQALPDWIESAPQAARVIAYAPAPRNLGREGATLILLRRAR
jgi:DNA-nicking Smr family endonuclease